MRFSKRRDDNSRGSKAKEKLESHDLSQERRSQEQNFQRIYFLRKKKTRLKRNSEASPEFEARVMVEEEVFQELYL